MHSKPLPDLGQQNARLAASTGQVIKQLDGMTARIDAPNAAAAAEVGGQVHVDAAAPNHAPAGKSGLSRLLSVLKGTRADSTVGK